MLFCHDRSNFSRLSGVISPLIGLRSYTRAQTEKKRAANRCIGFRSLPPRRGKIEWRGAQNRNQPHPYLPLDGGRSSGGCHKSDITPTLPSPSRGRDENL